MGQKENNTVDRESFLEFLIGLRSDLFFYEGVVNSLTQQVLYKRTAPENRFFKKTLRSLFDVPDFLQMEPEHGGRVKILKAPLTYGFLIDLRAYEHTEDYLRHTFGKRSRSKLRRYKKRLDQCISPNYRMYYGEMEKEVYDFLFAELETMIKRRFAQKREQSFELPFLPVYQQILYRAILDKKGSMFVIYDGARPINISINFIYGHTLFSCNSCYDIDYSAFSLGNIDMVTHLDWCFEHGLKVFDAGRGDFIHKRKWVNTRYLYQRHIFYDSSSLYLRLQGYLIALKTKAQFWLLRALRKMNLHIVYGALVRLLYRQDKGQSQKIPPSFVLNQKIEIPSTEDLTPIDLSEEANAFLRKPLYDFLYTNHESKQAVTVLGHPKHRNKFYFKGKNANASLLLS